MCITISKQGIPIHDCVDDNCLQTHNGAGSEIPENYNSKCINLIDELNESSYTNDSTFECDRVLN